MSTLKISGCMSVVKDMGDLDRDALLERLDQYRADGVPVERAQVMATADTMAELEDERREFMRLLKEQHPDIFTVTAPAEREGGIRKSADRQIDTPEFKKWFGDSKVVDENGDPLVVYHGTPMSFDAFGVFPAFFTEDAQAASAYALNQYAPAENDAGPNVVPVYLALKNPKQITGRELHELIPAGESEDLIEWSDFDELANGWRRQGFDGAVIRDVMDYAGGGLGSVQRRPYNQYVAFRPEQIKSATGSSGAFDPNSPNITKSTDRQTETPEFKRWFGDSRVVDAEGRPLVVYHGTRTADRLAGEQGFDSYGAHFGTAEQANDRSAGEENTATIPVYLSIQNPKRVIDDGTGWSRKIAKAKAEGYDGLVYLNRGEGLGDNVDEDAIADARTDEQFRRAVPGARDSWVAFKPEQIKSATGNSGAFDSTNPDITKSTDRQTETPEFKRWFADSVMTENGKPGGEPLVLYHGGFGFAQAPDGKAVPKVSGRGALGVGFYMTPDEERARGYAEDNSGAVSSLYVRMERPLEIRLSRGQDPMIEALVALGMDRDKAARKVESAYEKYGYVGSEVKNLALNQGYDGLVEYIGNKMSEVVVWNPTQVKSATSNDGGFSWNPDIRRSTDRTPLGFYSALARGLQDAPIKSAPAGAWKTAIKGLINKGAVKADEVEWSGINDWLDLEGQLKPVYESGYGLIDEHQNEDGTWQQVDDLGTYFRTKDEAESAITDELRRASEEWAKKEGVKSRISVESFDNLDFGKTVTPKITKEQVAQYLEQGGVQVEETVLGAGSMPRLPDGWSLEPTDDYDGFGSAGFVVRDEDGDEVGAGETEQVAMREAADPDELPGTVDTKYGKYTLPGGENYREVLLTLPGVDAKTQRLLDEERYLVLSPDDQAKVDAAKKKAGVQYRSKHWDQPNVLAHIRVNDRTDADGKRVLFVEELQSDWGQEGKKRGFGTSVGVPDGWSVTQRESAWVLSDADGEVSRGPTREAAIEAAVRAGELPAAETVQGTPIAPFVTKTEGWLNLALKRVMVMAAEGGYDKVAFVNGEQSADRYDLSKQVTQIIWDPKDNQLIATPVAGETRIERTVTRDQLPDVIGKESAERLLKDEAKQVDGRHRLRGEQLKVGGEGMKTFYDTIVPTALKKLLPKVGGGQMAAVNIIDAAREPEMVGVDEDGDAIYDDGIGDSLSQPGFDVTDAMREKVAGGVPLFSRDRDQTQTPEFKKWFGDSKVVDKQGRPMVMYHGTTRGGFSVFDRLKTLDWRQPSMDTVGSWFSNNPSDEDGAGLYAATGGAGGDTIYPVYLSIQNPKVYRTFYDFLREMHAAAGRKMPENAPGRGSTEELRAKLKEEGYDGIEFEQTANESLMQDIRDTQDAIERAKQEEFSVPRRDRQPYTMKRERLEKTLASMRKELDFFGSSTEFDGQRVFIAFEPEQIKSAIGNSGAFDPESPDIRFSVDRDFEPEKTVKAYKLFRTSPREPGKLFPLFVNADKPVPMGQWLRAEEGPAAAGGKVKSKLGPLAYRPGWHAGDMPVATHIGMKPKPGDNKPTVRNPEHVWAEVEFAADVDWQEEANKRGTNAQGKVVPVKAHITDRVPEGGFYRYKTNPKMTGTWLIGGEMKVNRVLSDADVKRINDKAGVADLPRERPLDLKALGFAVRKSEDRDGGEITIDFSADKPSRDKAKAWVAKVNEMFPRNPMNGRQRVMMFGEDDMVIFELDDSVTVPGAAEVKWFQAYPLRSGNGTKGMQELQRLAAEDNMPLTLYPWDKGRVSQAALTKFYKKNGFTPIRKGGKDLVWRPGADITKSADRPWFDDLSNLKISTNYQLGDLLKTSKKLSWWDRTVGTQYNIAQKHPQFKRVFDAVQRFINDVSAYATRAADLAPSILPKLETLKDIARSPLSAEDVKALRDPIFGGTLKYTRDDEGNVIETEDVSTAGVVFTNDELRELFGLNDRQIGLYREFRRATSKSLTDLAVSDMLRYLGTDGAGVRQRALEATNLDGALDAMVAHLDQLIEQQPQRAKVLEDSKRAIKEKAGQAIGLMARGYAPLSRFGQFTVYAVSKDGEQLYFSMFENERDANKMAREMREQYPDATVTTGTMSQESYKLFSGVTPETLSLFGESLGLEESGVDAKSEVFQAYLKMAKTNRSAMKRLIQRKGIDGFSEDAGRVLAGFVYSNARQISTNLHASEISRSASEVTDGDVKDAAIRLMEYVQNPMEEAQAIRGLLFTQFIGGSIASALVNMTQPFTMTLPYLSQFDGATGAAKRMADAVTLVSRGIRNDDDLQKALKRGEELGIVSPQEVHQLMAQAQGRGSLQSGDGTKAGDAAAKVNNSMAKLGLVWGKLFSAAEQFNRRVTFIAAYKLARDQGMPDPMAFAEQAIAETQGVYNKGNKPKWARGAVGSILFTFKQYSIAYVEFLRRMATSGEPGSAERRAGQKAVGLALGVLFLTAGMSGLPGADDLDDVIDGLMQRVLGRSFDSKQAKKEFFASILGQSGAEFVMSGLSGLPGVPIDISGRMGLGNLIPGTGIFTKKRDYGRDFLEVVGPAGTLFANIGTAAADLTQGEVKEAAKALAPVAAQNAIKAVDMAQMGYYRDMKGRKVVDTDNWDALAKSIGFQPRAVAQVQDATMTQANLVGQNKLRETEIADKWARGRIERKPDLIQEAKDELADWNRKNPESKIRIDEAQINKRVIEANKTKAARIAATAPKEIRNAVKKQLESEGAQ